MECGLYGQCATKKVAVTLRERSLLRQTAAQELMVNYPPPLE